MMTDQAEQETTTKKDLIADGDPECLFADGWDDEIIGTAYSPGRQILVVYDGDAIIEHMIKRDGMTYEEAEEYFSFNIEGAWVGDRTPVFFRRVTVD